MDIDLFDYALPEELIARHPPAARDGGRLLVLSPETGALHHRRIVDLPALLPKGALLVANDTRVLPARLRGTRPTGGAVELLLVRELCSGEDRCRWLALGQANKPLRLGDPILLGDLRAEIAAKGARGECEVEIDVGSEALRAYVRDSGEVPLPPYLRRRPVAEDAERYQTVFARHDGSVAAPTAGLHFTPALLEALSAAGIEMAYVTLHVGPGTFRPITAKDTAEHAMDAEEYDIGAEAAAAVQEARAAGRPVIAVGTTVTRALEGAFAATGAIRAGGGATDLFIVPGFEFRVVDGLLTNFHLPRSTLLCLVSALAGRERILAAYAAAVDEGYRFYSYGDAMLIAPRSGGRP